MPRPKHNSSAWMIGVACAVAAASRLDDVDKVALKSTFICQPEHEKDGQNGLCIREDVDF